MTLIHQQGLGVMSQHLVSLEVRDLVRMVERLKDSDLHSKITAPVKDMQMTCTGLGWQCARGGPTLAKTDAGNDRRPRAVHGKADCWPWFPRFIQAHNVLSKFCLDFPSSLTATPSTAKKLALCKIVFISNSTPFLHPLCWSWSFYYKWFKRWQTNLHWDSRGLRY